LDVNKLDKAMETFIRSQTLVIVLLKQLKTS